MLVPFENTGSALECVSHVTVGEQNIFIRKLEGQLEDMTRNIHAQLELAWNFLDWKKSKSSKLKVEEWEKL